jgi:hypothetical protein
MNSIKNKLQELYCKKGLDVPVYQTVRVGGPDNSPLFRSSLIISSKEFTGSMCHSKREAEKSVAHQVFEEINIDEPDEKIKNNKFIIWIDEENIDNGYTKLCKYIPADNCKIIVSKKYHTSNLEDRKVANTAHRDGADVGIVMDVTKHLLEKHSEEIYIILSKDTFAAALVDLINCNFLEIKNYKKKAHHTCSVDEVIDLLNYLF